MRGTNHKILRAALLLFNTHGIGRVSQRTIADHIAISPGNLTYHFKKRPEIIAALFELLSERLEENLNAVTNNDLACLNDFVLANNKALFEYRFFLIDFVQITRQHPSIQKSYAALIARRHQVYLGVIKELVAAKKMRPEELKEEYKNLVKRIEIVGDFWLTGVNTTEETLKLKHAKEYGRFQLEMLYPYLTKSGQQDYATLY